MLPGEEVSGGVFSDEGPAGCGWGGAWCPDPGTVFPGEEVPGEGPAGIGRGGPWCPEPGKLATTVVDGTLVGGAMHLVQIVDTTVLVMVDTVWVT